MIRLFENRDGRRLIKPNEFSDIGDMDFVFSDPDFYKHTLVGDDSGVYAIICFKRYWGNCFVAFFLVSEDLKPRHSVELKRFVHQAVIDLQADRVQTDSVACDVLDKWHEFLGFTFEGTREKMLFNKDYNMWGFLKGRDF